MRITYTIKAQVSFELDGPRPPASSIELLAHSAIEHMQPDADLNEYHDKTLGLDTLGTMRIERVRAKVRKPAAKVRAKIK